ncbi:alpha/beta-hydrolase [Hypoxylon sp. FL0890]|nr:alpha/beta-hydrolase [Hypoxylon sp. FL0890]
MTLGAEIYPPLGPRHTHTVILLHGETHENGKDFAIEFLAAQSSGTVGQQRTIRDLFPAVRWVFPHAPWLHSQDFFDLKPKTVWFDLRPVDNLNRDQSQVIHLTSNIDEIHNVIEHEQNLVRHDKIFIGGFGQGFAAAYAAYFLDRQRFAGLIGLGGFAPLLAISMRDWRETEIDIIIWQQEQPTPIFLSHSRDDDMVPVEAGRIVRDILGTLIKGKLEYHEYEHGGAWINMPQGVDDIVLFLTRAMNSLTSSPTSPPADCACEYCTYSRYDISGILSRLGSLDFTSINTSDL